MARNKYDIDEILEDKFDINQLKHLFQYMKPYRGQLALALFLMLSSSALTMLFPIFISEIMDTYIPTKNIRAIVIITLLSLVIVLYACICIRFKIRITSRVGQAIVHKLRYDLFCHLQELPFSYYDERPHGKIQVRVVNYVNSLSDLLSNGYSQHDNGYVQSDFYCRVYADASCTPHVDLSVRPACSGGGHYLCEKTSAPGMADSKQ